MHSSRTLRLMPLLALGLLALLAAMWAGLVRLGWRWPALQPGLPVAHGPLMVSAFLGTVISLERAVALNRRWTYAGPVLCGLGGLALIVGLPAPAGAGLITLGSLGLVLVFLLILRLQTALFTVTMTAGALLWLVGNGLWLAGRPIFTVAPWWIGFLLLTIAGERLELSRVLRPPRRVRTAFLAAAGLFLMGLVVTLWDFGLGLRLAGAGMIALAAWLLRYDIARRTVKTAGLTRFIAASLLLGYAWLGVSGLLALLLGGVIAGPPYDAILHTFFLGFVMGMIFAHAPIILPAILRKPIHYQPAFYLHLALLHLSLLLRLGGDLLPWQPARLWGGLLNAIAILLFLANTARAVRRARRESEPGS